MLKQALVGTIFVQQDLRVNKEIIENNCLNKSVDTILIIVCLVVNFRYCVKVLTLGQAYEK